MGEIFTKLYLRVSQIKKIKEKKKTTKRQQQNSVTEKNIVVKNKFSDIHFNGDFTKFCSFMEYSNKFTVYEARNAFGLNF